MHTRMLLSDYVLDAKLDCGAVLRSWLPDIQIEFIHGLIKSVRYETERRVGGPVKNFRHRVHFVA